MSLANLQKLRVQSIKNVTSKIENNLLKYKKTELYHKKTKIE